MRVINPSALVSVSKCCNLVVISLTLEAVSQSNMGLKPLKHEEKSLRTLLELYQGFRSNCMCCYQSQIFQGHPTSHEPSHLGQQAITSRPGQLLASLLHLRVKP
ncbi:hypothetical protein SLA2020_299630 [Shorea laevis]